MTLTVHINFQRNRQQHLTLVHLRESCLRLAQFLQRRLEGIFHKVPRGHLGRRLLRGQCHGGNLIQTPKDACELWKDKNKLVRAEQFMRTKLQVTSHFKLDRKKNLTSNLITTKNKTFLEVVLTHLSCQSYDPWLRLEIPRSPVRYGPGEKRHNSTKLIKANILNF